MMKSLLPGVIREIVEQPVHPSLEQAAERGDRLIGYTCSYVPRPILAVPGLQPVHLRATNVVGTPLADTYLSSVLCPYTRSLLEVAMEGGFDHLDGWVFTAGCDHLRRLYDNLDYLVPPPFNHILDLPHRETPAAVEWFTEELRLLASALQDAFGVDLSDQALLESIDRHNRQLATLRAIGELRRRESPPMTGADFHRLLMACGLAPSALLQEPLEQLLGDLEGRQDGHTSHRARVMVVGSQLDDPSYLALIESMGALVVADRFCMGSIPELDPIEVTGDPLRGLAHHSLHRKGCPRMMEAFAQRVHLIIDSARRYRVHGIILEVMKFCDTWGVESSPLVEVLRQEGFPVLRLEREYALTGEGQLRTRVQAFLESMGR